MARNFWDGFDNYASAAQVATQWSYMASSFNFTLISGRFGGQALRVGSTSGTMAAGRAETASDRRTLGLAFRAGSGAVAGTSIPWLAGFYNTASNSTANRQIGVGLNTGGSISIFRAATAIWTSDEGVVDEGAWQYLGLSALIHASAGKVGLTLDGEPLVELTGINTQGVAGTTDILYSVMSRANGHSGLDIDDFYTDDTYISAPVERRVETLYPNADGAHLDLTPSTGTSHFAVVDEATASIADYLAGSTVGQYDELGLGDLSVVPTVIDGVRAAGFGMKIDAATRAFNYGIRSGASDLLGPDIYLNATLSKDGPFVLTDPATGVAFTPSGVNALKLIPTVAV